MRKSGCLLAVVAALTIFFPSLGRSEFFIGPYLGPSFSSNVNPSWEFYKNAEPEKFIFATRNARGVSVDPALILGGKIGYWFTDESIYGLRMPSWLKHFGFALDVSYRQLNWPNQVVNIEPVNLRQEIELKSTTLNAAFLFLARYGFLKDSEVPFGRLQPYLGIGPVIFVTNTWMNIGKDFRKTEVDLGLAVEAGLSYMIHPKVSLYSAFRYRYQPNHVAVDDNILDIATNVYLVMRSTYNMYDLIFGVAYHF
ncbi:MAG: hypothetical protein C4567_16990 [Deltaproteobacteria bacterium]|nr:MAG: hypothetical protein C4567_16990 [Deltaproteobacteria bacterium]